MDSTNFSTFTTNGVELSDTLSSWRKKTNGVITKVSSLDAEATTLETKVNTSDVNNNSIALGKIAQIPNLKVLGNTSGSTANVAQIDVLDQDTLSSNSNTKLATQQSIKAYVDNLFDEYSLKEPTSNASGTFDLTTAFTDIDLSSAVGANKALVVLSLQDGSRSAEGAYFRTNGETWAAYTNGFDGATALVVGSNEKGGHIVIMTDSAGKIEGRAHDGSINSVKYKVLAFQKQRV